MLWLLLPWIVSGDVWAAEIEIVCESGADSCDVTPSDTVPLFDPDVFPHYDLKPGDEFTRSISVTNNRPEVCSFQIGEFEIKEDTQVSGGSFFSEELMMQFSGDGTTTGEISFWDLFNLTPPFYITNIDPNETIEFIWKINFDKSAGNEFQRAVLEFDFDWSFECDDLETQETVLNISKENNTLGATWSSSTPVLYTIKVWTTDNLVDDVEVIDIPPDGFKYRLGSWTAVSDLRGDLKSLGITTEPTYDAPFGVWKLGDMQSGETVTLTYLTDIQGYVDPGVYPDLAWTRGTFDGSQVLGNDTSSPIYFVGTYVKLDTNQVAGIQFGSQVLGASTQLPDTGASTWIVIGAVFLILVGIVSMVVGRKKKMVNGD